MPDESYLPEEARKLPTLHIKETNLDREDLYTKVEGSTCRRCHGSSLDPDGDYSCLLCNGKGTEPLPNTSYLVCSKHPKEKLVNIGKRYIEWEIMGFPRSGFLAVRGCPICKIPVLSKV